MKKRKKDKAILVRVSAADLELFKRSAKEDGQRLSTWMREALQDAAGKPERKPRVNPLAALAIETMDLDKFSEEIPGLAPFDPNDNDEEPEDNATNDQKQPCALCGGKGWSLVNFQKVKCPRCGGENGHLEAH